MASNQIKIEVDYGNSVVKVEDLKIKFEELGTKVVATRNRINKAVNNTNNAMNGSVKALMRERDAWQNIQASLSTTSDVYMKYQAQIDKLDTKIAKLTDTRNREQIALKNSANGLRAQIAAMQQEMDNRILSNNQYRIANVELQKLKDRLAALTDTRQKHEIVQQNSIGWYDQEISRLREMQRNTALTREQVEKYDQQIANLQVDQAKLTGTSKNLSKAQQGMSSSAGAAGATVTELGRTIGDMPFGLMGVANNIQQLSQQFVDLQAKSGGTRQALQSVMRTMMGPAGFVVLINIATSAMLYFTRQKEEANKETKDFNESMLAEGKILRSLINIYNDANTSGQERLQIIQALAAADKDLAKALEQAGSNQAERNRISEEYVRLSGEVAKAEERRNKLAEENEELLKSTALTQEEQAQIQEYINQLTEVGNNNNFATQELLEKRLTDNEELNQVISDLAKATLEAFDAQQKLNDAFKQSELDKVKESFAEFKEELRLENFEEGPERIAEQIRVLKESITGIAQTYGTDSAEFEQAMLDIAKKEKEFRDAQNELRDEASDKERERLKDLADFNRDLLDDLEAQYDDYGLVRINQQEKQAIQEAKALGASLETINNITKYYQGEREKVIAAADERLAKKKEKDDKDALKKSEEALKKNQTLITEYFNREVDLMKEKTKQMTDVLSNFSNILGELDNISQARFDRQINSLRTEAEVIKANENLTKEQKEAQLNAIQKRENEIQERRIKSERDMFTLRQTLVLAEMVLKQRAMIQEQVMLAQLAGAKASLAVQDIGVTGATQVGKAQMSIGEFLSQLGPLGGVAFALSIGGVIASIVSARRKAKAEIAALSKTPISGGAGGGGATTTAPAFNVVGASAQNQLAQAIAGTEREPLRAYVVSSDVTTAQELDRKIVEGASI